MTTKRSRSSTREEARAAREAYLTEEEVEMRHRPNLPGKATHAGFYIGERTVCGRLPSTVRTTTDERRVDCKLCLRCLRARRHRA
jgi:hypothetical protein